MQEPSISKEEHNTRSYWSSRIFIASWIAYAGFYCCRKNISWTPLPTSSSTFHHGIVSFANLLTLFGLGYALGQFVSGWLADRYGSRSTLLWGGLLSALSTVLISPHMPPILIIALQTINGFGQGFGWPAINKLFSVWFPHRRRAVITAWWSTSYVLGGFLATALASALSTTSLVSITTGLRLAIVVPSFVLLLATGYFYWRVKETPEQAGLHPTNNLSVEELVETSTNKSWMPILRNREIQLLATMYFFLKMTRYALLFWLPLYLVETQHSSKRIALSTASLFELTGFIGALIAAYVSDKLLQNRRYPVGSTMMFLAAFAFLLHPLVSTAGWWALSISISIIGILIYGPDVLMASTAVLDAVPSTQAGRASGYVDGVGSIGQMLSPIVVMQCAHWFGWNSIFNLFVVCSLIAGSLLATRWDSQPNPKASVSRNALSAL